MKNLFKGLLVASVAASMCGLVTAPKASAQVIETTTTYPAVVDYSSVTAPMVLSQPAVIEPSVISAPAVINTSPMWNDYYDSGFYPGHLLDVGIPGLFGLHLF